MPDPTVSRVTAPREGLPPCMSAVIFDGRAVAMTDRKICKHHPTIHTRFYVAAGRDGGPATSTSHPEYADRIMDSIELILRTDDPDEAQAAFERGAEWVRTGEGP